MEKKQGSKKLNAEVLYNDILNYEIDGAAFYGDVTAKVVKAQQLLRNSHGSADEKEAFRLLQEVCYGKKKSAKKRTPNPRPVIKYFYPIDDEQLMMAAEPLEDRDLPLRMGASCACLERVEQPEKVVVKEKSDDALALAHLMLAEYFRMGRGAGKDPNEAIRMLRIADRYGSKQGARMEKMAKAMMNQIIEEEDEETIADTTKSYVEVRDVYQEKGIRKGDRYDIILHHADGTESEINVKGRNKLMYLLALMTMMRKDAAQLSPRMFDAHRGEIVKLVMEMNIDTGIKSYADWVNEFVYKETEGGEDYRDTEGHEGEGLFSFCSDVYSNTLSYIKKSIRAASRNEEERKTFEVQSTKGRDSVVFIGISPSQIRMPDSLMDFVKNLPTEVPAKRPKSIWMPYYGE